LYAQRPFKASKPFHCLLGAASERRRDGENYTAIAVADIPFRALDVIAARRHLQFVARVDGAVFGRPALWAPAAVGDAMLDGEVQRGPVSAGLTARHDLNGQGIHDAAASRR